MQELLKRIETVKKSEIQRVLDAVLERYAQLYPDWTASVLTVLRDADRNMQIDQMIRLLESMKE